MSTVLRLGFAMGGGVSLGTFCGAALTEAIKLLILYGTDSAGKPYDRVIVDVFSGASAGAMSLGVMLKALADPPAEREAAAIAELTRLYGADFTGIPDSAKRKDLIAAQIAQDMQRDLWVRQIHIRALLGKGAKPFRDLSCEPGLLDSDALNRLAEQVVCLATPQPFHHRRVLADRVLFACTLSNLAPIAADARGEFPGQEVGYIGLTDGMRSSVRRELRVFDLNFDLTPDDHGGALDLLSPSEVADTGRAVGLESGYPQRWCRYQERDGGREGVVGDLTLPATWAKIAATAIASGAFPFAFAPVVLTRRDYEFGNMWPRELKAAGITEYPFSYIDGGTFNNEPIREAYRMAAFLDAQTSNQKFERRVLFVDPFVSQEDLSLRVGIHATEALQPPAGKQPFDGFDPIVRSTLDRLLPHVGNVLGALSDESRTIESDKIFQTRDRFRLRDAMRGFVIASLATEPAPLALYVSLTAFSGMLLESNRHDVMIPPGNLKLHEEMERVIRECMADATLPAPFLAPLPAMAGKSKEFLATLAGGTVNDPGGNWLRVLACVALDLSLDLEGKSSNSQLVAIAPFRDMGAYRIAVDAYHQQFEAYLKDRAAGKDVPPPHRPAGPTVVTLPGGAISGFAGFMAEVVRQHDFDAGILCASEFLSASGLIPPGKVQVTLLDLDWSKPPLLDELSEGVDALTVRIVECIAGCHLLNMGLGLDHVALAALAQAARGYVAGLKKLGLSGESYQVRIYVPDDKHNLDGSGIGNDIKTRLDADGRYYLQTFATYYPGAAASSLWKGAHISAESDGRQVISVDRSDVVGFDHRAFSILLPPDALRRVANLYPNPILIADATTLSKGTIAATVAWRHEPGCAALEKRLVKR